MKNSTKRKKLARDLLLPVDIEALAGACGDDDVGIRNQAFIALVSGTGVRVSEALSARCNDLDLVRRRLKVHGKGGKTRDVWIHPDALHPLKRWMRLRKSRKLRSTTIICTLKGGKMASSYFRAMLPRWAEKVGLRKRVHPHGLRHAFACRAHLAGVPLSALAIQLGHSRITTTSTYLERLMHGEAFAELDSAFS